MENEKSVVEEYLNRGGFAGYAHSILADEFHKAESDKTHILWPVISLLNIGPPPINESKPRVILGMMWTSSGRVLHVTAEVYGGADYRLFAAG